MSANLSNRPNGNGSAEVEAALADHPFVKALSEACRPSLAEGAALHDAARGDLIFKQGDPARHFYLIMWGAVDLSHAGLRGNVHIQTLGPGEALGWSWLFAPYAWHFNAMAADPTRLIVLDAAILRRRCAEDKAFGYEFMQKIAELVIHRLQQTRRKLFKLSGGL